MIKRWILHASLPARPVPGVENLQEKLVTSERDQQMAEQTLRASVGKRGSLPGVLT